MRNLPVGNFGSSEIMGISLLMPINWFSGFLWLSFVDVGNNAETGLADEDTEDLLYIYRILAINPISPVGYKT